MAKSKTRTGKDIREVIEALAVDIADEVQAEIAVGEDKKLSFDDKLHAFKALTAYYKIIHPKTSKSDDDDEDDDDESENVTNFGKFKKAMNEG